MFEINPGSTSTFLDYPRLFMLVCLKLVLFSFSNEKAIRRYEDSQKAQHFRADGHFTRQTSALGISMYLRAE